MHRCEEVVDAGGALGYCDSDASCVEENAVVRPLFIEQVATGNDQVGIQKLQADLKRLSAEMEQERAALQAKLDSEREAGWIEGHSTAMQAALHNKTSRDSSLKALTNLYEQHMNAVRDQVATVALAITSQILNREVELDKHVLAKVVTISLKRINARMKVMIQVPADEEEYWRELAAGLAVEIPQLSVQGDDRMKHGECEIHTENSWMDLGIHAQLAELSRDLSLIDLECRSQDETKLARPESCN